MNEAEYRKAFVLALRGQGCSAHSHEDYMSNYVPDVSFAVDGRDGWVELKYLPKGWPKSLNDIKHYTKGQEQWLEERGTAGAGNCYLLIGVPGDNLLLHWSKLAGSRNTIFDAVLATGVTYGALGDVAACIKHYARNMA